MPHIVLGSREQHEVKSKKCKEMTISFLHKDLSITPLYIDDILVEPVQTHKILGLQLRNDLKWNDTVD